MKTRNRTKLIDGATGAITSAEIINNQCDSTTIQVDGTFTDVSLTVQGKIDPGAGYVAIALVNISNYSIVTNGDVTAKGIYQIGSDAVYSMQVVVNSVSGGDVDVYVMQVDSAEV